MFNKFCDYMYYLLTSPFKKVKKSVNQWYILFTVLGMRFDDAMERLNQAREQTMVATCDAVMLPVHAEDRGMARYAKEDDENFRKRIANYTEVCKLGGTNAGVELAVWSLGYNSVQIKSAKEFTGDEKRWAEFYVILTMNEDEAPTVSLDVLKKEVRMSKEVGAKDNYYFIYNLSVTLSNQVSTKLAKVKYMFTVYYFEYLRLDGSRMLDGSVALNSRIKEDVVMPSYHFTISNPHSLKAEINSEVIE